MFVGRHAGVGPAWPLYVLTVRTLMSLIEFMLSFHQFVLVLGQLDLIFLYGAS